MSLNPARKGILPALDPDFKNQPNQTKLSEVKVINVQEAKTHLSRLMDQAAAGEEVILGKHGKPMVRLSSFTALTQPRRLGGRESEIKIAPDFDSEDSRINAMFQ